MLSPRPGAVTINSLYARRESTVCGMSSFAKRLLQVGLLSSIASKPLSSATSLLAVSINSCVFMAVIDGSPKFFSAGDWNHWLWMAVKRPAQITSHQIDHHGREHQNHAEPNSPVPMRASPIRRMALVN